MFTVVVAATLTVEAAEAAGVKRPRVTPTAIRTARPALLHPSEGKADIDTPSG